MYESCSKTHFGQVRNLTSNQSLAEHRSYIFRVLLYLPDKKPSLCKKLTRLPRVSYFVNYGIYSSIQFAVYKSREVQQLFAYFDRNLVLKFFLPLGLGGGRRQTFVYFSVIQISRHHQSELLAKY